MRILILVITSISTCYAITISQIPNNNECNKYLALYKQRLNDPIIIQDVLRFVLDNGYSNINTEIGKYLLTNGYKDYAQYCIEHICSKAIGNLIKMGQVKPKSIEKAYLDYTYIGKKQIELANIDPIIAIKSCSESSKIPIIDLKLLLKDDYYNRLKQVVYGVSNIESKMEDIVIQA